MSFVLANASSVARMLHLHNDTTTSTVNSFLVGSLAGLAIVSMVAIAIVRHKRRRAEGTASIEETVVAAAIEEAQCVTVKRARRTLGARKDRLSPESLEEISMGAAQEPLTPTRNVNFDKVYCADRRASRNKPVEGLEAQPNGGRGGRDHYEPERRESWHLLHGGAADRSGEGHAARIAVHRRQQRWFDRRRGGGARAVTAQ